MALLIGLLYPANLLRLPDHQPTRSSQFVFLLVTAALWLGLIDSCREIVKERTIILRELVVGVRLDAYLLAKAGVLFLLAAVQCVLLVGVATAVQPLHAPPTTYLTLCGLLILTSWSAIGIGLVVSTLARSVDQATSLIPLLLIPQLLFGGALVPFARMAHADQGPLRPDGQSLGVRRRRPRDPHERAPRRRATGRGAGRLRNQLLLARRGRGGDHPARVHGRDAALDRRVAGSALAPHGVIWFSSRISA